MGNDPIETAQTSGLGSVQETGFEPDETVEAVITEVGDGDVLDTPVVAAPKRSAEAHVGTILGASIGVFGDYQDIIITLVSTNAERQDDIRVWMPQEFFNDIYVTGDELSNKVETGRQLSPRQSLGAAKQTIDQFRALAKAQGRSANEAAATLFGEIRKPTTIEEYVDILNVTLAGVSVIYRLQPDRKPTDPQYANILRVRGVFSPEVIADPKRSGRLFKNHRLMWEDQEETQ